MYFTHRTAYTSLPHGIKSGYVENMKYAVKYITIHPFDNYVTTTLFST
jgi:hypothetical protein